MAEVNPPVVPTTATPCEVVFTEVSKYDDWNARTIFAIAQSENGTCDPGRHNETSSETHYGLDGRVVCVGSYGVLQVGCVHYREGEDPNDLTTNIRVAHRVWQSQGYTAWTEYRNGGYLEHLK